MMNRKKSRTPARLDDIHLTGQGESLYLQFADEIHRLIAAGMLKPGDRLPPQRDIARQLDVSVTTLTRAFATLKERGLVLSRPGRGSIVSTAQESFLSHPSPEERLIDLTINRPPTSGFLEALGAILPNLHKDPRYNSSQDFPAAEGATWTREVVARWLAPSVGALASP